MLMKPFMRTIVATMSPGIVLHAHSTFSQNSALGLFDKHGDIGALLKTGSVEYDAQTKSYLVAGGKNMWFDKDAQGHPASKDVMLRLMSTDGEIQVLAKLFGGQGTINVPSWSPDSQHVAFVSYARKDGQIKLE
jgi:hypothetical protein